MAAELNYAWTGEASGAKSAETREEHEEMDHISELFKDGEVREATEDPWERVTQLLGSQAGNPAGGDGKSTSKLLDMMFKVQMIKKLSAGGESGEDRYHGPSGVAETIWSCHHTRSKNQRYPLLIIKEWIGKVEETQSTCEGPPHVLKDFAAKIYWRRFHIDAVDLPVDRPHRQPSAEEEARRQTQAASAKVKAAGGADH